MFVKNRILGLVTVGPGMCKELFLSLWSLFLLFVLFSNAKVGVGGVPSGAERETEWVGIRGGVFHTDPVLFLIFWSAEGIVRLRKLTFYINFYIYFVVIAKEFRALHFSQNDSVSCVHFAGMGEQGTGQKPSNVRTTGIADCSISAT